MRSPSRLAQPHRPTLLPTHPDQAPACHTPTERARPSLSLIQADKAAWQREQRQRDLVWQQFERLEAQALES